MQTPSPLPSWSGLSRSVRGLGLATLVFTAVASASAANLSISLQQLDRAKVGTSSGQLGTIDLTAGGLALDWLKPIGGDLSAAEKDATNLLNFSILGTFGPASYSDDGYSMAWSGGDSASVSGSSVIGSNDNSSVVGRGFRLNFVAPAPGDYIVKYYSAANGDLTKYRLEGFQGATSLDGRSAGANIGSDLVDELVWTVQITADTIGQSFNLDLTRQSGVVASSAIAITGASVVAVPEPMSAAFLLVGAMAVGMKRRRR